MPKKNEISISFHHLEQSVKEDPNIKVPFTVKDMTKLVAGLDKNCKSLDTSDPDIEYRLKINKLVKIKRVEIKEGSSIIQGLFEPCYWGHSFENSKKGTIDADSMNFRPFYFLLYLTKSGKIYIGSQYLGSYGGYTPLKETLIDILKQHNNEMKIESKSFHLERQQYNANNLEISEICIEYSQKSPHLTGDNTFKSSNAITMKKPSRKDTQFGKSARNMVKEIFKQPDIKSAKKIVSEMMNRNTLVKLSDEDIDDAKIIAMHNGNRKVIKLIEASSFATKFPIQVSLALNQHPVYEELQEQALYILKNDILGVSENV